jgi:hypothetical protein
VLTLASGQQATLTVDRGTVTWTNDTQIEVVASGALTQAGKTGYLTYTFKGTRDSAK